VIDLTPEAEAHLDRLAAHYEALNRLDAAENLLKGLEAAKARISAKPGRIYSAPRPYPALEYLGWRWLLERHYWIAYSKEKPPLITAIFHESANIPGWY
jgi:plasmid stabilization system protein ParE